MPRKTGLPACVAGKKNYIPLEMTPERLARIDEVFSAITKAKKTKKVVKDNF